MSCPTTVSYFLDNIFLDPITKEEKLQLLGAISDRSSITGPAACRRLNKKHGGTGVSPVHRISLILFPNLPLGKGLRRAPALPRLCLDFAAQSVSYHFAINWWAQAFFACTDAETFMPNSGYPPR